MIHGIQPNHSHNVLKIKEDNVRLTPREMDIFQFLYEADGNPLPIDKIIFNLYNADEPDYAYNSVCVHVHRINKKINPYGFQIYTISARGYKLADINETAFSRRGRPPKRHS
jgi:DNA-binding response OmpR family regulator